MAKTSILFAFLWEETAERCLQCCCFWNKVHVVDSCFSFSVSWAVVFCCRPEIRIKIPASSSVLNQETKRPYHPADAAIIFFFILFSTQDHERHIFKLTTSWPCRSFHCRPDIALRCVKPCVFRNMVSSPVHILQVCNQASGHCHIPTISGSAKCQQVIIVVPLKATFLCN